MRTLLLAPLVLVFALLAPAPASAVTVSEIVSLSKAGVSEQVILALIDRDKTIFSLPAEEIVTLQKAGLSDAILDASRRRADGPLNLKPEHRVRRDDQLLVRLGRRVGRARDLRCAIVRPGRRRLRRLVCRAVVGPRRRARRLRRRASLRRRRDPLAQRKFAPRVCVR